MNELPPLMRDQRKTDHDQLKLLSVFHFIGAGLGLFGIAFLFMHYTFMHTFFDNPKIWEGQKGPPPPAEFFVIFRWFYIIGAGWFILSSILNLISGFSLRARKHRTFSLVVAGINCIHMPLGTLLGVFTLIVLLRDSVREQYEARQSTAF